MTTATKTRWPTMSDYQEAVQAPSICFPDADLKSGSPVMNKLGLPRPICGQFASVYEIETGSGRYAVKCFLRNIPDQHERYARISAHLGGLKTPYFVTFQYQNDGIRVQGELRPLVKMEWIEGLALNRFIEKNLSNPKALRDLEGRWLDLLEELKSARIAHGDLQHGNVLVVEDGSLRLIDYDGMWVPALAGQTSHETGHPNYQSPRRNEKYFHAGIDLFAGAVIQIAVRALSREPGLWSRYNNGDNLLFRRQDYLDPGKSALFAELRKLGDDVIEDGLKLVMESCTSLPRLEAGRAKRGGKSKRSARRRKRESRKRQREKAREKKAAKSAPAQPTARNNVAAAGSPRAASPRGDAAPAPGAVEKKPSSWIADHVKGGTEAGKPPPSRSEAPPGAAPKQSPTVGSETPGPRPTGRRPRFFELFLHVVVLAPMAVPWIAEWFDFLGIRAGAMTLVQETVVNTVMVLGVLSLATLVVFRKLHHRTSDLLFGVMTFVSVFDLSIKLRAFGPPASLEENLYYFGFSQVLLITSGLGWVFHPDPE